MAQDRTNEGLMASHQRIKYFFYFRQCPLIIDSLSKKITVKQKVYRYFSEHRKEREHLEDLHIDGE
jgi:hypothetical protein